MRRNEWGASLFYELGTHQFICCFEIALADMYLEPENVMHTYTQHTHVCPVSQTESEWSKFMEKIGILMSKTFSLASYGGDTLTVRRWCVFVCVFEGVLHLVFAR